MLILAPGESVEIPFVYKSGYDYIDPSADIRVFLRRGTIGIGPIILRSIYL